MTGDTSSDDLCVLQSAVYDYVHSPVIRVVLDKGRDYFVHQDLITARSEFFKKAIHGDWKEAQERKVLLPDDEVATFGLYLQLLYTKKLPVLKSETPSSADVTEEYLALSKLYVLAEKLIDENTKAVVLAAMTARSRIVNQDGAFCYPELDAVRIIYNGTTSDSPARQLLVQLYTDFQGPDPLIKVRPGLNSEDVPKEFLFDLSVSLLGTRVLPEKHRCLETKLGGVKAELSQTREELRVARRKSGRS